MLTLSSDHENIYFFEKIVFEKKLIKICFHLLSNFVYINSGKKARGYEYFFCKSTGEKWYVRE